MCLASKDIAEALVVKIEYCPLLRRCKNGNLSNFNSCEPNNISNSLLSLSNRLHEIQFLKQDPFCCS